MASTSRSIEQSSDDTNVIHGSISFNVRPAEPIPSHFRTGEFIRSESRHTEFKAGGMMVKGKLINDVVDKYIVGFLNSEGGALYIGVGDNDCSVVGIVLKDEEKSKFEDKIKQLAAKTEPPCTGKYTMHFVEVRPNRSTSGKSYVIIIDVPQQKGLKKIYQNSKGYITVRSNVINVQLKETHDKYDFEKKALEDQLKNEQQLLEEKRRQVRELEAKYKRTKHEVDALENNATREIEEKEKEIEQMKEELEKHRNELAKQQEENKSKRQEREENIARFHVLLDGVRSQALEELQNEYKQAKEAIKKWDTEPETSSGPSETS